MEKIQIEALERIVFSREMGGPMESGDRRTYTDPDLIEDAIAAVQHGWAKATSGEVETGERRVINAKLSVEKSTAQQSAEEVNHG